MSNDSSQGSQVTEYSPIAKALTTLDAGVKQILKKEIAYLICNYLSKRWHQFVSWKKGTVSTLGLATRMIRDRLDDLD